MKPVRIGVIGAGHIAQMAHLPILAKLPETEIAGLCDVRKSTARAVAARFGITSVESDYETFVHRDDIDAVVIATPTDTHFPIGMAAVAAGKHVLVEKPLTRDRREAERLAAFATDRDRVLMVGMNARFRQDITALKSLIAHGELGTIFMVQAGWLNFQSSQQSWLTKRERSGGGVFMDLGIVMADLILWLLDFPDIQTVSSTMYHHKTKTVEDSACCFIRLSGETSVSLQVSWNAMIEKQQFFIDIIGSRGSASINPLRIHKNMAGSPVNVAPVLQESGQNLWRRSYEQEVRHFTGAVRGLYPPVSTGSEAAARMRLVEAVYQSSAQQREITVRS